MNSLLPTQIGFIPGVDGSGEQVKNQTSELVLGRNVTGDWEAIGFGKNGRPDYLEKVTLNIAYRMGDNTKVLPLRITIDANVVYDIWMNNADTPSDGFNLITKEVAVCETDDEGNSTEKRMIILASETYLPTGEA